MHNILTELPPVGNWLAPGGLIAIWCTNNLKMINKVKEVLFKRWGVELIAEWVWLKVFLAADVKDADIGYLSW
jgi:N6-adenosine-specific RNA methylase IME4